MPSSLTPDQIQAIEKNALLNAVSHAGKAEVGAVVSKSLGASPALRTMAKDVAKAASDVVKRINALSPAEQQKLLEERYPEALIASEQRKIELKKVEETREEQLPPLAGAVQGKVVLRLPPEPSGYMHIGHAMAGLINDTYKRFYNGELWLRFEDTNPKKVKKVYYQSFKDGYSWLGIAWDKEKNVSSDIDVLYTHARRLIEKGDAYACACPVDRVKTLRFEGVACEHRDQPVEKNLAVWEGMLSRRFKEGEYVIRLKGDLSNLDHSLRDPNLMRIIDSPHTLVGDKYVVWPIYDFENVVEDMLCGVTHVLRSSEFHVALQDRLRELLGFPTLFVEQFSRFNFKGTPVQKRLLRPLVEEKVVTGWDDPRMPTIEGVKRRGIVSEAIRQFTMLVGYTKTEHTFDWSLLFAVNRKVLDPISRRLFFVPDPALLSLKGAPSRTASIPFHPTEEKFGKREVAVAANPNLWVPSSDLPALKTGDIFRLMDLYNARLTSKEDGAWEAEFAGDELMHGTKKLQWVTDGPDKVPVEVLEPSELYNEDGSINPTSLTVRKGYAEAAFATLIPGDIVQFPRYGFVRVDTPGTCVLAHP
jgi:glutamyl-tRNA synthetase